MFYTVKELADKFKVDRRTIIKFIKVGELKAIKVGRAYRIREEAVNEFFESNGVENNENT